MTEVLWMNGHDINWIDNPPNARHMVKWSKPGIFGQTIHGSLRTIAWLDRLSNLAVARFGHSVDVIQGCFNVGVAASAGTHDKDAVLDIRIPGVNWWLQQRFVRANGGAGWYRHCPEFCGNEHIHVACLPADGWHFRTDVGIFVPGQILDYHNHAFGLSGEHTPGSDDSWFPKNINATAFDLSKYIANQRAQQRARRQHKHN